MENTELDIKIINEIIKTKEKELKKFKDIRTELIKKKKRKKK